MSTNLLQNGVDTLSIMHLEKIGQTAILRFTGMKNPIGPKLVKTLGASLEELKNDEGTTALLLTGTGERFFSLGLELPVLLEMSQEEFRKFFFEFNQLCLEIYTFPKPTVVALNGHAVAGGCVLALCFDHRFARKGKLILGLNEVKLGVPVPFLAASILRQVVGEQNGREIMETGEFVDAKRALEMRLVDRMLPSGELLSGAVEFAGKLGALGGPAFRVMKENRTEAVVSQFLERREEMARLFLECWFSREGQARLQEALEHF